ncbi:MAG: hypothetical protein ACK52I_20170 [Pseudomonadota bacterium]
MILSARSFVLTGLLASAFFMTSTVSFAWSLKPPKTGIGIIDNNRDVIGGIAGGTFVSGPAGALVGAWWGDHEQAQNKIDELRRNNNQLAADLAQAKLDKEVQRDQLEKEIRNQVEQNNCLKTNSAAYNLILNAIDDSKATFNTCLENSADSDNAQGCLNSYDSRLDSLLRVGLVASQCE